MTNTNTTGTSTTSIIVDNICTNDDKKIKDLNNNHNNSNSNNSMMILLLKQHCNHYVSDESPVLQFVFSHVQSQSLLNADATTTINSSNHVSALKRRHTIPSLKIITIYTIITIPLFLLFHTLLGLSFVHQIFHQYFIPITRAARWVDNNDRLLHHEYTYYKRICTEEDVSTHSLNDLIYSPTHTTNTNSKLNNDDYAVETIMKHGAILLPNPLSPSTMHNLRSHILQRNNNLSHDDNLPLDTPDKRLSFALSIHEHPSVLQALQELSSTLNINNNDNNDNVNYNPIPSTLTHIIGPNPAIVELTSITAYLGASAQGWHPDVKPQGSSVLYSQTFTHSYSLFIPLQNVTYDMGVTELCPGTHYCANSFDDYESLESICMNNALRAAVVNEIDDDKNGSGNEILLMNQALWHRGGAYDWVNGGGGGSKTERVVLILTFLSRPNPGIDNRQLSHGTYFHLRHDMYGFTLDDFAIATTDTTNTHGSVHETEFGHNGKKKSYKTMVYDYILTHVLPHPIKDYLRSMGIYKTSTSSSSSLSSSTLWGWDFISTTLLRISNFENGYTFDDLLDFVQHHTFVQYIPNFLLGDIVASSSSKSGLDKYGNAIPQEETPPLPLEFETIGWIHFIEQTIGRFRFYTTLLYGLFVFLYLLMGICIDVVTFLTTTSSSSSYSSTSAVQELHNKSYRRPIRNSIFLTLVQFIIVTNVFSYLFQLHLMNKVHQSPWAISISSHTIYSKPFPIRQSTTTTTKKLNTIDYDEEYNQKLQTINHDYTTHQKSTIPTRQDILIGSRFDSKYIYYYNRFLDYHPGNLKFRQYVDEMKDLYFVYSGFTSMDVSIVFQNKLIQDGMLSLQQQEWNLDGISSRTSSSNEDNGSEDDRLPIRYLQQNMFGEWTIIDDLQRIEELWHTTLLLEQNPFMKVLYEEIGILIAQARFGAMLRNSVVMKQIMLKRLKEWRGIILDVSSSRNAIISSSGSMRDRSKVITPNMNGRFEHSHPPLNSKANPSNVVSMKPSIRKTTLYPSSNRMFSYRQQAFHHESAITDNRRDTSSTSQNQNPRIKKEKVHKKHKIFNLHERVEYHYNKHAYWNVIVIHVQKFENGGRGNTAASVSYLVLFGNGHKEFVKSKDVDSLLRKMKPFVEGEQVMYYQDSKLIPGVITRVYPDLSFDVKRDGKGGEMNFRLPIADLVRKS